MITLDAVLFLALSTSTGAVAVSLERNVPSPEASGCQRLARAWSELAPHSSLFYFSNYV